MGLMSKTTASYIAGLIDGEGWIGVSKVKCYANSRTRRGYFFKGNIAIANTNKSIIDWLKESFGGCVREDRRENRKRVLYQWGTQNPKYIIRFLTVIRPYLRIKRAQADNLILFCQTFNQLSFIGEVNTSLDSKWKVKKIVKPEIWDKREEYYEKSKQLNGFAA